MATITQLLIGALSCLVFVLIARSAGSKREVLLYAGGLVFAASVYVVFAVVGGAALSWVVLESSGLVLFSLVTLFGLRVSVLALALGWAAHAAWDVLLHGVRGAGFVPDWYPVFCVGFDLCLAGYIAVRERGRRRARAA